MWRNFSRRAYSQRVRFFSSMLSKSTESFIQREINHPRCQVPFLKSDATSFSRNNSNPASTFDPFGLCKNYNTSAAPALVSRDESEQSGLEETRELTGGIHEQHQCVLLPLLRRAKKHSNGEKVSKYLSLKRRQIKIETQAWEEAAKEYDELLRDMCEKNLAPNLPYVKSLFLGWFEPLKSAILAEQEHVKKEFRRCHAHYILHLSADMLAVITMHKMMGLLMSCGEKGQVLLVTAATGIGEAVEHEARIQRLLERIRASSKVTDTNGKEKVKKNNDDAKLRKEVMVLMKKNDLRRLRFLAKRQDDEKSWSQDVHAKLGSRLIELLIESAYVQPPMEKISDCPPDIRPAFFHAMKVVVTDQQTTRRYGVIDCDPLVRKGLEKSARHIVTPYMPMLVPPLKWRGYDKGAYFFLPSFLMRTHGAKKQREVIKKTDPRHLSKVFEALDTLGNTKWRINKRILAVVDRIWASGGALAGIVDREDIPNPEEPSTGNEEEIKQWKWKLRNIKKQNRERHSERCSVELKLTVAHSLTDEEGFFYPHNLDFRGRAYPMHPHLNHLGSDVSRGLLEFAEGRPLGASGLRWLKIHLANQFGGGVDKYSYDDRVKFADSHIEDIYDSADHPLEGKGWWLKAEDPLQCLATCINLSEAIRSPDPHSTISHLPIHQDGSCNGLQHYAALGRDKLGAASVNLVDVDKPADVYSRIAERVSDIMEMHSKLDPSTNKEALYSKLVIDQVDRKLVKQTVMTSVYGVTFVGARDQIKQRLKERGVDDPFEASCYVAKITLKALDEMFDGARTIMGWLGNCAKLIASQNKAVRWTTPLGLPVVQPYHKLEFHAVKTSLQMLTLRREGEKVMPKRQKTAFPPNLVHSLDGSHMMMTAVACRQAGLNFAGVHDSYWTHACDVDALNRILRHKFVELYDSPILEKLLEEFQAQFPALKFPAVPDRGDFDLQQVLTSRYFFN